MAMMNPFEQQKKLEGVKYIIAVAAGKGGVGKSTVSTNLATALSQKGLKVGLLDADIYGPSVPHMTGTKKVRPNLDSNKKIIPIDTGGLKVMSIGYLIEESAAVIWRGPMLFKAMDQLLRDVNWGELDILLVDMPPGTGDVQLSLAQKVPVSGAIIVTTPQDISMIDVTRCVDMFDKVKVPIIGVIENMAGYTCPHCKHETDLFPKGKSQTFFEEKGIMRLGSVPFTPGLAQRADQGTIDSTEFRKIADELHRRMF